MGKKLESDIIQWDVRAWSKALRYWEEGVDWQNINSALELGARQGGLSMWLAQKGISTVCSDYSDTQEKAAPLHSKHKFLSIEYQDIDATKIPYENHFDLIVFKSIVGGIAKGDNIEIQKKVFDQIHKALKKGGVLLFAENLSSTMVHKTLRRKLNKWGDYWRYISFSELDYLLGSFRSHEVKTSGVLGTLGRTEKQKEFLTRIDELTFNYLAPSSWHYIGYGIAKK